MKPKDCFLFFVENLTFFSLFYVLPSLFVHRLKNVQSKNTVYFIDKTRPGFFLARFKLWFLGFELKKFQFRQFDVRDNENDSLRLKVNHMDVSSFKEGLAKSEFFTALFAKFNERPILKTFLVKQIALGGSPRLSLGKIFFLICAIKWQATKDEGFLGNPVLFLNRRPWPRYIAKYAEDRGIKAKFISDGKIDAKEVLVKFLGPRRIKFLRNCYYRLVKRKKFYSKGVPPSSPHLGAEYYGQLHLGDPKMYSDLFFYPPSGLQGKDVAIVFSVPRDPLDEQKLSEIKKHGMNAVIVHPRATVVSSVPIWDGTTKLVSAEEKKSVLDSVGDFPEPRWLKQEIKNYFEERDDWQQFFESENIKVYTTWFKYTSLHCVMADAIRRAGGVMTVYQRAFDEFPSPDITTAADVVFAFSKESRGFEERNSSFIPYHITVGYLADFRFPLLRELAREIKNRLQQNGAKHILAYFDENSLDDDRWHFGHEATRENYAFLLEKVLKEPWFGLVLKPKAFKTLQRRLGNITPLLDDAVKTGRCFIFKEGAIQVSYPPAVAALAADIAVHGHLYAATAGMEAALAGVPTLLLDREGWSVSKFYRLGQDRVVFSGWDQLWKACEENREDPGSVAGLGDWSPLLNDLDSFRDGRAAERMGIYLKWLLDGFKEGKPREKILADAAERYARQWGKDKITSIAPME